MSEDANNAFRDFATPALEHALLTRRLGAWDLTVQFFQGPGLVGFESKGISRYTWMLGGRVLENHVIGDPSGHPYEGRGFAGFDTRRQRYWFVWFDSMSTGLMRGDGRAGADGSSVEWDAEATDVMTRGLKRIRSVERHLSPNEWMSQVFDTAPDGAEFVRTQFRYLRRAPG